MLDTAGAELDAAFHLNVTAAFELVKQATPQLLKGGHGSVVNISPTMDRMAGRGLLVYGTIKAALSHMMCGPVPVRWPRAVMAVRPAAGRGGGRSRPPPAGSVRRACAGCARHARRPS